MMPFSNLGIDQQVALISAGAALLGSVIGAASTLLATWLNKKMRISGKISLHTKIVYVPAGNHQSWGYYTSNTKPGLYMLIPLWLDVCNTSGISRILRNVNIYAYLEKKEIASFTQIQRLGDGENVTRFGENESYTLVVPENSAKRFELLFVLYENEVLAENKEFDELVLTYFDEKNSVHAFHFAGIKQCWVKGALPEKRNWITLDRRCNYAR